MLNFIYYPVSFILWCWHKVFGFVFGDATAISWILGIVFLTFTVRGIMFKPFVNQVRSMKKMQDFAPEMKKIQKKYANDKQRQAAEMQKLQREHGVNPLGSCLPMLLQIPVFIGLNWVLRAFNQNPVHPGQPKTENYFFSKYDVDSYIHAKLFGVNLGDAIHNSITAIGGSGEQGWHWNVAPVSIPLMIIAALATHFNARHSAARANPATATAQSAMMQKLTIWIFPLGVLVFGALFPLGLLCYWVANNGWTLVQQRFVYKKIDRDEAEKKSEAAEKRASLGPKPGQKPTAPKVGQKPVQKKQSSGGQQGGGQAKKITKAGSPQGFAQTAGVASTSGLDKDDKTTEKEPSANGSNSKENGTGVPGLIKDSTKKSGRKRR